MGKNTKHIALKYAQHNSVWNAINFMCGIKNLKKLLVMHILILSLHETYFYVFSKFLLESE